MESESLQRNRDSGCMMSSDPSPAIRTEASQNTTSSSLHLTLSMPVSVVDLGPPKPLLGTHGVTGSTSPHKYQDPRMLEALYEMAWYLCVIHAHLPTRASVHVRVTYKI